MDRIGSLYLAVACCVLGWGVNAQTPPDHSVPPPFPEAEPGQRSGPNKKNSDDPGKKDGEMGRRGEGGPMFGFGMGGPQFEKMVELALGPEKDLDIALENWPRIKEKGPEAQERFLKQIENFRRFLRGQAMREAEQMGLKIKPGQEDAFVRDYWKKKVEVDQTLRKEAEPRRRELTDKMNEELKRQFGS